MDTVISTSLLVMLARKWHKLAVHFDEIHKIFSAVSDGKMKNGIHLPIRIAAGVLLTCGFLQHMSSKTADLYNQYREAEYCGWEMQNFSHYFASRNYSFIFKHIRYNILILLFFEFASTALTMSWSCHDLMIILTSIGITFYFRQIVERVQPFKSGVMIANEKFWMEIRSHYVLLCELVKETNGSLSLIIIHSCGKNLYLLCYELINISRKDESIFSFVHHWCSLINLIIQTVMVFYSASMMHETAKAPLTICSRIPNFGWCSELERYIGQLKSDRVAYTGMGFFHLTKRSILAMAGSVVTYELVMLKFAEDTEGVGDVKPCSNLAFSKD
ncbi:gustatory receptor for sugar taste 64a-like [Aedes albopictus]|uniref:Gustatory receptor n=1 Tax=Aedes albopictus TaxID=7160 RepID=A0ABM1Y0Q2_AEDAL